MSLSLFFISTPHKIICGVFSIIDFLQNYNKPMNYEASKQLSDSRFNPT